LTRIVRPVAGEAAYLLFSLGILGTGFLAVPVLAGSAAYAVAETFRWHEGLYRRFRDARGFYTIIVLSTGLGAALSLGGIDPIKALLWSAALNGIIAPVILYFVVALSGRHAVMGAHGNSRAERVLGWGIVFLLSLASIAALWALL
jgi:Mn2+/Fe2+ NRAMP family transporter